MMLWRSKNVNPKAVTAFTRLLLRIWLPFSAFWIIGAMLLNIQAIWLIVGPPGLVLVIIAWCAYTPEKPLLAIVIGVAFLAGGYWVYEIRPKLNSIDLATASPEKLLQYKSEWARLHERLCKEKLRQRLNLESASTFVNKFCECSSQITLETLSRDDLIFNEKNGELPSETEAKLLSLVKTKC